MCTKKWKHVTHIHLGFYQSPLLSAIIAEVEPVAMVEPATTHFASLAGLAMLATIARASVILHGATVGLTRMTIARASVILLGATVGLRAIALAAAHR